MIKADIHTHTAFSTDSDTPMEDMIEAAIGLGLDHLCITEHMDKDYPTAPDFFLDTDSYKKKFFEMKEKYADRIGLLFGVELGLLPHLAGWHEEYIKKYPFDFIIGSEHNPKNVDPYYPAFFEGRSEEAAYTEYFEETLVNLKAFSDFDALGHMDYVVRYGPNKNKEYSYSKYSRYIDPILEFIVNNGIALEVNAGGYKKGLGEPNPCRDIIIRYKELGGEMITVASDAHSPEWLCYEFDRIEAMLVELGFKYYTVFENRQPVFYPLG